MAPIRPEEQGGGHADILQWRLFDLGTLGLMLTGSVECIVVCGNTYNPPINVDRISVSLGCALLHDAAVHLWFFKAPVNVLNRRSSILESNATKPFIRKEFFL